MMPSPLRYLFPKNCIFCGCSLSVGEQIDICGACSPNIPYFAGKYLFECGGAYSVNYCDRIVCALKYTDFVRAAVSGYKFHDRREYGPALAALLCERIERAEGATGGKTGGGAMGGGASGMPRPTTLRDGVRHSFDFVACVPLSRKRLHERGYNQASILAQYTARYFGLPYDAKLLSREGDTLRQSALRRAERYANVQSAFRVNMEKALKLRTQAQTQAPAASTAPVTGGRADAALSGARIILIDDIATSMSTIHACAAALKSQGAATVLGAVLAGVLF